MATSLELLQFLAIVLWGLAVLFVQGSLVDEGVLILSALGLISVVRMCLWSCAECSLLPALMVFNRNWSP
jgi:hypothetical protein